MKFLKCLVTAVALTVGLPAIAQEAVIRKNLTERIPQMQKIAFTKCPRDLAG